MRSVSALAAGALLLVGCQSARPKPGPAADERPEPANLDGQWQLSRLGSQDLTGQSSPVQLTAKGGVMLIQSQCVWWFGRYTQLGKGLRFQQSPRIHRDVSPNSEPDYVSMCARGLTENEQRIAPAFEQLTEISSWDGSEVMLAGPAAILRLNRLNGIEGNWSVKTIGGKPLIRAYLINQPKADFGQL